MKSSEFSIPVPAGKSDSKTAVKASAKASGKTAAKNKASSTKTSNTKAESKPKEAAKSKDKPAAKKTTETKGKEAKSAKSKISADTTKKESSKVKTVGLVSKELAQEMMHDLCKLYPDADCELTHKNDFELLTSVILSAQTTDVTVNKVTPNLFKKFPTAKALAEGDLDDIKELIKATGFFNNKAKAIQACASAIMTQFNGKVPNTLEELTKLPGVGRKTANVVLGVVHNIPGWTVDTHVQRLSQRLGFTKNTDPYKIEMDLQELFPKQDWTKYSITIIWHGRRLCFARKPDCIHCPLNRSCPSSEAPLGK